MSDKPKFGAGAFSASIRQGFGEVGMLTKAVPESIQVETFGTLGKPAASEVLPQKVDGVGTAGLPAPGPEMEME